MLACRPRNQQGSVMARTIVAIGLIAVMAVMAGPVFAQKKKQEETPYSIELKEKKKEAEAVDRQYKATMKRTEKDDAPVQVDPWQNMRGTDNSKTKR